MTAEELGQEVIDRLTPNPKKIQNKHRKDYHSRIRLRNRSNR